MAGLQRRNLSRRGFLLASGIALIGTGGLIDGLAAYADDVGSVEGYSEEMTINARFNQIFDRYEIGDTLSPEDAAFVQEHALSGASALTRATHLINGSRTVNGITYQVRGNWYHDDAEGQLGWHTYGATIQAGSAYATSQEITVTMRFMAYGYTGGSYELVHKDEQPYSEQDVQWCASDFTGEYWGVFTNASMSCYAYITPYSGSRFLVQ